MPYRPRSRMHELLYSFIWVFGFGFFFLSAWYPNTETPRIIALSVFDYDDGLNFLCTTWNRVDGCGSLPT